MNQSEVQSRIQLKLKHIIPRINVMFRLLKPSAGGIGQYIIATASWIGLYRIVAEFGKEAVAGDTYTPTVLNLICFWLIEIPLAYIMSISIGFNET